MHEHGAGQPDFLLVEKRDVALDKPCLLEGPDAAQAGGFGQADDGRKLDVADAAVPLQLREDGSVVPVENHEILCEKSDRNSQKMP